MKEHSLLIGIDEDGHFMVAPTYDRKKAFAFIKELEGGDALANSSFNDITFEGIKELLLDEYVEFINEFTGRGQMEIVTIEL